MSGEYRWSDSPGSEGKRSNMHPHGIARIGVLSTAGQAGGQGPFCSRPPARPRIRGAVLSNRPSRSTRFRTVRRGWGLCAKIPKRQGRFPTWVNALKKRESACRRTLRKSVPPLAGSLAVLPWVASLSPIDGDATEHTCSLTGDGGGVCEAGSSCAKSGRLVTRTRIENRARVFMCRPFESIDESHGSNSTKDRGYPNRSRGIERGDLSFSNRRRLTVRLGAAIVEKPFRNGNPLLDTLRAVTIGGLK